MTDFAFPLTKSVRAAASLAGVRLLSEARRGDCGVIQQVGTLTGPEGEDLERRLLELGFVEGARIELLHEGAFGRDPIAVRLDDMRVALRRREARAVSVRFDVAQEARIKP